MPSLLKLPDIWRVIREVDLESIRHDADGRFRIVVLAATRSEAEAAAVLLTGEDAPHPWLELRTPGGLDAGPAELEPAPDDPATLTAALIVTRSPDVAPDVAQAGERLRRAGVPVATVVHGSTRSVDAVVRPGETARTTVAGLEPACVPRIADVLAGVVTAGMRLALARQLPPVRDAVFDRLIEETAKANAAYALTAAMAESVPVVGVPLNLADMAILTKNQLVMGYKIALGAGKSGRPREVIGEVLGVIGGGFLFRQAARQLVGLIPVAGVLPKVAIAYTGTWAIGRAVVVWATQGRRPSPAAVTRFSKDAAGRGRAFARGLIRNVPESAHAGTRPHS